MLHLSRGGRGGIEAQRNNKRTKKTYNATGAAAHWVQREGEIRAVDNGTIEVWEQSAVGVEEREIGGVKKTGGLRREGWWGRER